MAEYMQPVPKISPFHFCRQHMVFHNTTVTDSTTGILDPSLLAGHGL